MKRKLRVGIIGSGRIAGLLQEDPLRKGIVTHVAAYQRFEDEVQVVACTSRKQDHAKRFASRFRIPFFYNDYKKMLSEQKPDIVSICAYSDSRYKMIRDIAEGGSRAIFCEKPVASSLKEADAIIDLCRKKQVRLAINHTRRWGIDYQYVKKLLKEKVIGDVQSVIAVFSGDLFHTGTHMFDILHFLLGKSKQVEGYLTKRKTSSRRAPTKAFEDFDGRAILTFEKDIQVFIEGTRKDYFIFELDLIGTKGRIRIGNHLFEVYKTKESPHYQDFYELQKDNFYPEGNGKSALELAVSDLVGSFRSRRKLISRGEEARDALEVAFGILESDKKNGKPVNFPLKKRNFRVLAR